MGRRRIASETEALRVMDRMRAEGKPVSVRSVTVELGGGSSATIAAYVRAWRRAQDRKSAAAVLAPGAVGKALAESADALWEALQQAHAIERAEHDEAVQAEIDATHQDNEALRDEIQRLTHKITELKAENRVLREQIKGNDE